MAKRAVIEPMRFELPFAADAPQVVNPTLGIDRLATRASQCYTMDVTVIDTPDNRLLRSGVVLAHRITDGIGEWYFAAPGWGGLPDEAVEPVGAAAELPDRFAKVIRPIRRQALVGPIAGLTCERHEYVLKSSGGEVLGAIRDDQVTIRRGGLIMARYREASVLPTRALTSEQADFVAEAMIEASAARVARFPTLQARLGAPATGLTDFPAPGPIDRFITLERFAQHRFASRLRDVVTADIALLAGDASARGLVEALQRTRRDVRGLAAVLDPVWREQLEAELAVLEHIDPDSTDSPLQGQELLRVIDALVSATRAPRLGDLSQHAAAEVFFERVEAGTLILIDRCMSLKVDAPDERWAATLRAAEQLQTTAELGVELHGKLAKRFLKRLSWLQDELRPGVRTVTEPTDADLDAMTPRAAYAAGRAAAESAAGVEAARMQFVADWPDQVRRLRKLVKRA